MSVVKWRGAVSALLCVLIASCGSVPNEPFNKPLLAAKASNGHPAVIADDGLIVGVALSGGGTRAAAYGLGILQELDETVVKVPGHPAASLFEHADFVSGVSGGSVLAAYVGLHNRDALKDFREKFLLRNAEENLSTSFDPINLGKALGGGINEAGRLTKWLDDNLFSGATLGDMEKTAHPHIYLYASDIYNAKPFVFSRATFDALCSDYANYPVSQAVAASAAVPFVFSPIVLETFPNQCNQPLPHWVSAAAKRDDSAILKAVAQGLQRYRDPETVRYIKLVDGGVTDNFGVSGFVVDHEQDETPYAPLSEHQAVMLTRALILVSNAGQGPAGDWGKTLEGPGGVDLVNAVTDTMIKASSRAAFDAFRQTFKLWRDELVRWRCKLTPTRVQALRGTLKGWNCRDVNFYVAELSFDQLGAERAKTLGAIPTRFKLPAEDVDKLIAAGRETVRNNPSFQAFTRGLRPTERTATVSSLQD